MRGELFHHRIPVALPQTPNRRPKAPNNPVRNRLSKYVSLLASAHEPHRDAFWPQALIGTRAAYDSISKFQRHRTSRSSQTLQTPSSAMPPKQRIPAQPSTTTTSPPQSAPAKSSSKSGSNSDAQEIVQNLWNNYVRKTPQRVKLIDTFMGFLVVVGALQFLYVVIVGNFVRLSHTPSAPFSLS